MGTNMIVPGKIQRQHVTRPSLWNRSAGTDFWFLSGASLAGIAADELMTDYGWTLTSITSTAGSLADLLSSADVGTPTISALDAASDLILSPTIFGDYAHGLQAGQILGHTPTTLNLEVYANFSVHTASETTTGFGLSTGSGLTATNHIAYIYTDGTNFNIRGTPGTGAFNDVGAVDDALYHLFRITATAGGTTEWFIDGTSQGTITLVADLFPTAFSASVVAAGTNRVNIAFAHLWYS